jgi:hypothetical protein
MHTILLLCLCWIIIFAWRNGNITMFAVKICIQKDWEQEDKMITTITLVGSCMSENNLNGNSAIDIITR